MGRNRHTPCRPTWEEGKQDKDEDKNNTKTLWHYIALG